MYSNQSMFLRILLYYKQINLKSREDYGPLPPPPILSSYSSRVQFGQRINFNDG